MTPAEELAMIQLLVRKDTERCTPEVVVMLRKLRQYYIESIADAANQIRDIDSLIEEANMAIVGDEGL